MMTFKENLILFDNNNPVEMKKLYLLALTLTSFLSISIAQTHRKVTEIMPTRQVHLDFHTSEHIPDIGKQFDKKQFQEALKLGNINQINIFAKGHHSWSYYPTKVGKIHPNLDFDLLGAQIEACHEIGVKCPIYFTVGWSVNDAENHPEWVNRNPDGSLMLSDQQAYDFNAAPDTRLPGYMWKFLMPIGEYHNLVMAQVEEILQNYEVDGFWFDIYHFTERGCYSDECIRVMREEGIDFNDHQANLDFTARATDRHMKALRALISKYKPEATVYFNPVTRLNLDNMMKHELWRNTTHQDLEDLPTTWEGYDKMPIQAKYHLQKGWPITAMSGKFHKAWGEFGGFKHPDAIKYEAAAMIAFGAGCNFGDQLHPSGLMDLETYRNIGEAYQYVEQVEEYGPGGVPFARLGVWFDANYDEAKGVTNLLLEMHKDFELADEKNYQNYELLIIPGKSVLTPTQGEKLNAFAKNGGKLIVIGEGALLKGEEQSTSINIGAKVLGKSEYHFDYTVVKSEKLMSEDMVTSPFLNYESGLLVQPQEGKALASIRNPYFNRTYEHFSSHRETPYQLEDSEYPAVLQNGNIIFIAHALDMLYTEHGVRLHRELLSNVIDMVYENPVMEISGLPSTGRVSLLRQEEKNRYVAHLLYSSPIQRGSVQVIEDFVPVKDVEITLDVPQKTKKVYQVPEQKALKMTRSGNKITVVVPEFTMHTAVVFEE